MAKKDTYLALLRRGIDENTAHILSNSGVTVSYTHLTLPTILLV